ncbi:MAG TPA: DUF2071 domain-containing protein [Thermoanaerobaculia bacterium]|jgi:hypothetical protein|nr:DUF2071 domain-containing protein [Thermoanaerobaculia bacterium]
MHQHDAIDRISPTLEPDEQVLMHQNWHHLLFLHWEIPPQELQALIPPRLTIDTFEGKAYIGLVPFTMTGVRPILTPSLPWISSFHEVNVRTYVHLEGRDPGVWFFSLDASSRIAVAAARAAYHLAYFAAEMDFRVGEGALPTIEFDSRRDDARGTMPANAHIRYRASEGPTKPAAPGTLEHFLIERYILYAQDDDRRLFRARVHHQPYPVQRAEVLALDETLVWASRVRRTENVDLRHYAREVNVKVYPLKKV